jgi:hypothetical protein
MNQEPLSDRFSMFVFLKDSQDRKKNILVRQSNPILKGLMNELVEETPQATEDEWARYFLKTLIEAPKNYLFFSRNKSELDTLVALTVLVSFSYQLTFCYLQLICFYVARKMSLHFQNSANLQASYPLEECFAIAAEISLKPAKLLRKFNFELNAPVHGYARIALHHAMQDRIVKELKSKSFKFSDNGLLKQLNPTLLENALKDYGVSASERMQCRLAWQAFKDAFEQLYPSTNSAGKRSDRAFSSALNERQLDCIAERYNELVKRSQLAEKAVNAKEIQGLLNTCIQVVRNAQNRQTISLDNSNNYIELATNSVDELIEEESQQELVQMRQVIIQAFEALEQLAKTTLLLWLGLGISQSDFTKIFSLEKQYQIARQFQRYQKKALINALKTYYQNYLAKSLSEKQLDELCNQNFDVFKNYLIIYSQQFFALLLGKVAKEKITEGDRITLQTQKALDSAAMLVSFSTTTTLDKNTSLVINEDKTIEQIWQKLEREFTQAIQTTLNIQLAQFASAPAKITKFIEKWLQQN